MFKHLRSLVRGELRPEEPLAPYTTWGVGGNAELFFRPRDILDLTAALAFCAANGFPVFILGAGSNILVSDQGVEGLVIKLENGFKQLKLQGDLLYAGSAVPLNRLVRFCERQGLAGMEFCAGIPGSFGGGLAVNAGAWGKALGEVVHQVSLVSFAGRQLTFGTGDFTQAYRFSSLRVKGVITGASLKLQPGEHSDIAAQIKAHIAYRHSKHPWKEKSAGSVFKNPMPRYAWELVHGAGGTGKALGGAQISTLHSNFIINTGNATAKDIWELITWARLAVKRKYNIELETEIIKIGRW